PRGPRRGRRARSLLLHVLRGRPSRRPAPQRRPPPALAAVAARDARPQPVLGRRALPAAQVPDGRELRSLPACAPAAGIVGLALPLRRSRSTLRLPRQWLARRLGEGLWSRRRTSRASGHR